MQDIKELKQIVAGLFAAQKLAVLSSYGNDQPYASLVAFTSTDDLKYIYFATTRATRKYANLMSEAKVALLIDSRSNSVSDFSYATAVTALGRAEEVRAAERDVILKTYLDKHPYLKDFVSSPTCALLRVKVEKYYVVNRFQDVRELVLK